MSVAQDNTQCQPKRSDVGYKRPPKEHQFKKGHKPPPRKRKRRPTIESSRELLSRLLNEPRRVLIDDKPAWMTTAALLVHKAYEAAEQGSPTLQRLLSALHFADEPPGSVGRKERWFVKDGDSFEPLPGFPNGDSEDGP